MVIRPVVAAAELSAPNLELNLPENHRRDEHLGCRWGEGLAAVTSVQSHKMLSAGGRGEKLEAIKRKSINVSENGFY